MKNWCYAIGCFLVMLGCKNQPGESSTFAQSDSLKDSKGGAVSQEKGVLSLRADEDSIRKEYDLPDSITLIDKYYIDGESQYSFIIHNKGTIFHERLKDFFRDLNESGLETYKEMYKSLQEEYRDSTLAPLDSYNDLVADWVPVYSYEGNFYVVKPCNFFMVRQLTDTTFLEHYMDGPVLRLILDVEQDKDEFRIELTGNSIKFKLVDPARSIYLFNDGSWGGYIIPLQRINELPIIVEGCSEDGVRMVKFDQVPYDEDK